MPFSTTARNGDYWSIYNPRLGHFELKCLCVKLFNHTIYWRYISFTTYQFNIHTLIHISYYFRLSAENDAGQGPYITQKYLVAVSPQQISEVYTCQFQSNVHGK